MEKISSNIGRLFNASYQRPYSTKNQTYMTIPWSAIIFAHNEAATIIKCLDSVLSQDSANLAKVFVLSNGSKDSTHDLVNKYSDQHANVILVDLPLADKANAWNHYIHTLSPDALVHFFIDGDLTVTENSFGALSKALKKSSQASAAGALPMSGRNITDWSRRMQSLGRLAGGFYALKGDFVAELKEKAIRIPIGLIGEDFLVTCLVKRQLSMRGLMQPNPRLIFSDNAGFIFTSLSLFKPLDWISYAKRLVRYQIRDYQLMMLLQFLEFRPSEKIPANMQELFKRDVQLPHYSWRGRYTLFDMIAVRQIRKAVRLSRS